MKHKALFPRTIPVLASLLLTMLCAIGCTQTDLSEFPGTIPNESDEPIPITIAFNGVETMFGPYGAETRKLQSNKIHFSQEYDKTRMIETIVMAEPDTLQVPLDPNTRGPLANTTLRIVAYEATTNVYKGTGVFTIDEKGKVTPKNGQELLLNKGKYIFHCLSPEGTVTENEDKRTVFVSLPSIAGADDPKSYYVTASATVEAPSSSNEGIISVPIPKLIPQCCKLTVSVNAPGKNVSYDRAEVTANINSEANIVLPGGVITISNPPNQSIITVPENKPVYVYPGDTGELKIVLVNVRMDNELKKKDVILTSTEGIVMESGIAYNMNITQKKKNWIQVEGMPFRVAMGNLYGPVSPGSYWNANENGLAEGVWKIGEDQGTQSLSTTGGDYFNWAVRDPLCCGSDDLSYYTEEVGKCPWGPIMGVGSSYPAPLDDPANPCYHTLGKGWHVPTRDELNVMSASSVRGSYKSATNGVVQGSYLGTTTVPSEANQDKVIFLPFGGYRGGYGESYILSKTIGHYWSTTPNGGYSDSARGLWIDATSASTASSEKKFKGGNIRCVSYPPSDK